ncbi:unnamed protein product [Adineta steineri]|uniref:RING-type domain-containing protein n=1 Tax=Adineta steineri TaxID=433720 RepID=A0A816BNB3_9BILA|nr:unnamed protein product [Adineta steineri]CAF1392649.1 unnamed protein product [Adineta steineri]CAF1606564.1 unnamed protein product [Adineta steineri]CAF1611607.1 unnamed protein product [Adineta steineri]
MPPPTTTVSRKRTRSTNISESNNDHEPSTSTMVSSLPTNPVPPKRQRNNPPSVESHTTNYSLRNRSVTSDSQQSQRYNLRPRHPQSQIHSSQVSVPHSTTISHRTRRPISSTLTTSNSLQQEQATPSTTQPRQYRLVYISDDDDQPTTTTQTLTTNMNTTFNLVTDNEDDEPIPPRRTTRSTSNTSHNIRSRTVTDPTSTTTIDNQDFTTGGVAHVRLNRAIEIVIDSIQSLEGAVNNFDQLVFSLIYGRLNTRTEFESLEGMIRLSRILNLNFPSRLTQDEIDALPKIKFLNKSELTSSTLLAEKCPICLTEFNDQEIINKLHCTHLFHLQCISTWLSENDSCPTCRRKVNGN